MIRLGEAPVFHSKIQRLEEAFSLQRFVHRSKTMAFPIRTKTGLAPWVTSTDWPVLLFTLWIVSLEASEVAGV